MAGSLRERFFALPWWHPYKQGVRLLIYFAIGFVVICGYLYVMQNRMIYPGASERFTTEEAQQNAWMGGLVPWSPGGGKDDYVGFVRRDFTDRGIVLVGKEVLFQNPRGTIVILHGNGEYAWEHADDADRLIKCGFRTLLYEYPGYGGRPGSPSELTIVPDVREVVRALDKAGLGPVFLWGQSLGSSVAAAACADETLPVHGLLLLLPADTLPNAGAAHYPFVPVHLLMTDRYNSVANLAHFTKPVCIGRADHDTVIPPRLSIHLYESLPGPKKEIVFKNCDHNTFPGGTPAGWLDEALDFIAPR